VTSVPEVSPRKQGGERSERGGRGIALRARLLLAFLAPTWVLLATAGFFGYRFSRNLLEDELGTSLSSVAATVASQLSAERLLSISEGDDKGEGSRTWRSLSREVGDARTAAGARRIFAFVPELSRDGAELAEVWAGKPFASQVLFEGNDGRLYKTGYAPLLRDGKVVGAIGVEGSAEFFGPLRTLARSFLGLLGVTLGILAAAALITARALSVPLERLVAAATRIGKGDLTTRVASEKTPEIGMLASQLEAMREALESRDRQLKMMLGGVAHEVKNPLGGIELFAGLLHEELSSVNPNSKDALDHTARIRRELDYLKRIVDDFLAFAREQKMARAPFAAAGWLQTAADVLTGDARQKKVTLLLDAADDVMLEGDFNLLTSALVNLVKNAVQASPEGKTVRLSGRRQDQRYVIEVCDEGAGIPGELQARIFEPFFTTREKGTGLGLPLARKLVEAHRGTLSLESAPGKTTFRLELPL
jgi:signal transduction histidine kinase